MSDFDFIRWREKMGWTQQQAAMALGISRTEVQRIEINRSVTAPRVAACIMFRLIREGKHTHATPELVSFVANIDVIPKPRVTRVASPN